MAGYLDGKRILLRPMTRSDLPELRALLDDRGAQVLTGSVYPMTDKDWEAKYERCQATDSRIWFVVVDKAGGRIIGETGFLRIFMPWRTADLTIEIWDADFRGRGYGKETAALMFEYGFDYLNFHRLAIGVVERNGSAMRFWKSVGFVEEGRQVEGFFSEGRYSDFVMMRLLEDEYRASHGR